MSMPIAAVTASLRTARRSWLGGTLGLVGVLLGGCATAPKASPPAAAAGQTAATEATKDAPVVATPAALAVVAAADRSPEDRLLDDGRHPAELLTFFGVTEGQRVADLAATGGYTTELLARAVGPSGKVFGQNSPGILKRFAEKPWTARLAKPVMANVVRADREFEDPLPAEATNLDAVFLVIFYHDTVWLGVDRDRMNRAIFAALKPGGVYAVVDHSGRPGTGISEANTLHRIEESTLRSEIEKAGFRLAAAASFLRNPADARDWNPSPRAAAERRGQSDRFVLKFVKP